MERIGEKEGVFVFFDCFVSISMQKKAHAQFFFGFLAIYVFLNKFHTIFSYTICTYLLLHMHQEKNIPPMHANIPARQAAKYENLVSWPPLPAVFDLVWN
mgnify:CR=1 FL=1